jgi:predicted alpha/beta superfamily hydrolase
MTRAPFAETNSRRPARRSPRLAALSLAALVLAALGASATAIVAPAEGDTGRPIVIGRSFALTSAVLGDTRRVNVWLPDGYGDTGRRFPVVVLLDGGEAEDFHHITGLARINAAWGQGQEVIVVGVEGVDRKHDLTSPSASPSDRKILPTSGGADAYRRFLNTELWPWIAARYRVNGRRALMGESLAGLFTAETLLKAPTSFDDYIIVSPSLWWNAGALAAGAAADLRGKRLARLRAVVAFDEPAPPVDQAARERAWQDQFAAALRDARAAGLSVTITRPGETHGAIYHPAAMAAFRTLYGPAANSPPR